MTSTTKSNAEFSQYADGYAAGMEHPLKRLLGGTRQSYLRPKIEWINQQLNEMAAGGSGAPSTMRVLEVGCADGELLRGLRRSGFGGELHGCDVSEEMLTSAAAKCGVAESIEFRLSGETSLLYEEGRFDAVILCDVLHHVPFTIQHELLGECLRVLRVNGQLCIIEHNPWNPVTRFVVATTAIDQKARLVSPRELRRRLEELGQPVGPTLHFMFFPPRLSFMSALERALSWFPLGGQYSITCKKTVQHNAQDRHPESDSHKRPSFVESEFA